MSTQDIRMPPIRYARSIRRRKPVLNVDLNAEPPAVDHGQEGTSVDTGGHIEQPSGQGGSVPNAPIDVEALEDEVIISSPRAFAEAKNNSRRNPGRTIVVDVDSEYPSSVIPQHNRAKRRRSGSVHTIINSNFFINLEGSSSSVKDNVPSMPPPVKEPTFSCAVCLGSLVEETSTKCGHIFCKKCIKAAVRAQGKCPTCRKKVTSKDLIRVYLPAAS